MSILMIILSIFGVLSLVCSVLVVSALMLSSRISQKEEGVRGTPRYMPKSEPANVPQFRKKTVPAP